MTTLLKTNRSKIYAAFAFIAIFLLATVLVLTSTGIGGHLFPGRATSLSNYSITLDSSNKVVANGEKVQKTKRGNDVKFSYSGTNSSTTGHVTLSSGGSIVNTTEILSIQSITATFSGSGTLKFKTAYGGDAWTGETTMESGYTYELGSDPYYVSFNASNNSVIISEIVITFGCYENPNAAGHTVVKPGETYYEKVTTAASSSSFSGDEYLIVNVANSVAFDGSLTTLDANNNNVDVEISNDRIAESITINAATFTIDSNGHIKSKSGYYIGATSNANTLNTSTSTQYTNTVSVSSGEATIVGSGGAYLRFNEASNTMRFRYYKSGTYTAQKPISLFKKVVSSGGSHTEYDTPEESIIGFTASVSKTQYYHDEVFNESTISAYAKFTGGKANEALAKGGDNGYSYVIKNSNDNVIDATQAFGLGGTYTLEISYKNFSPICIQLTVDYRVSLTAIEVISTNTIFNTAQKLSDFTSGITANLTYSDQSENIQGLAYSNFASKDVELKLLNPNNVEYSITSLFGTAGTWTIKVVSTNNPTVYDTLEITVNAIPVESISVTGSSATVEEELTLQLTANVNPSNATNSSVTWSSNHESIATVNANGLVTGVSAGEARITATATDGSQVFGFIDITVTAKPVVNEHDAAMTAVENAYNVTVDGSTGIRVGKSGSSGTMTITVGAGATKLSFYAAGWTGTNPTITLTGATLGQSSFNLTGDSGISGTGSAYTLSGNESDYYYETTLSGITSETSITVTSTTTARFALWNAKYYLVQEDPVYPTAISLTANPSSSINVGGTTSIEVGYTPGDTNIKNVTFSSSNENVATVSAGGVVTGVAAGSATITATAEAANNGTVSKTITITVSAVAVSGVAVSPSSLSLTVGDTEDLVATVSPDNATNKTVTWSSDDTSVAQVSNTGKVTAVAAGEATITVTSQADNTKKATCTVTVTESGGGSSSGEETTTYTFTTKSWGATPANWTSGQDGNQFTANQGIQVTSGASGANGTSPVSFDSVQSVVVGYCTNASKGAGSITVYVGETEISSLEVTTSGGTSVRDLTFTSDGSLSGNVKISVECTSNSIYIASCSITTGTPEPVYPESITISPSSLELAKNGTRDLTVNYYPSNTNQNKDVTWSRYSGSTNIDVSATGKVTVSSTAQVGNTAVIRATLTNQQEIHADCTVTVVEQALDDQTILIYMCGSDLESDDQTSAANASGYATMDIQEIVETTGKPDNVNVVFETGGAKVWKNTYGVRNDKLGRYHVSSNNSLVSDSQITKANMGLSSTLQSFVTWGVQTYPADRISLILWNHGGAMKGVCYDELYSNDSLTNKEVNQAIGNTFNTLGRSTSNKFEWIGYDACLMEVQDIAEFNSQYFNYMVGSQESEAGYGWKYDEWLDDAYSHSTTETILQANVDSFIDEMIDLYKKNSWGSCDQTLSYLDLSYAAAYKNAWETMSTSLYSLIGTYGQTNFQNLMKTAKAYGDSAYTYSELQSSYSDYGYSSVNALIQAWGLEYSGGYYYDYGWYNYGIFDAKDVLNKILGNSNFNSASSVINNAINAFGNLVKYNRKGNGAGNSNGLCCYFPLYNGTSYNCSSSTYYTQDTTNFSNWRSITETYGDH